MTEGKQWVVVGVSGVTCGGKTTLADALQALFPEAAIVHQDTYFLPPEDLRHTRVPNLNHLNWEILSALDMDKMHGDVKEILSRDPAAVSLPLLIVEGFLIFVDPLLSSLCRHKLFFTLTREQCWARRSVRVYEPADVPGYFDQVVWPEYEQQLQQALALNPDLTLVPGTADINALTSQVKQLLDKELNCVQPAK